MTSLWPNPGILVNVRGIIPKCPNFWGQWNIIIYPANMKNQGLVLRWWLASMRTSTVAPWRKHLPKNGASPTRNLEIWPSDMIWLVEFGAFGLFVHSVGKVIIPTDEVIFFRGVDWNHQPAEIWPSAMILLFSSPKTVFFTSQLRDFTSLKWYRSSFC